MHEGALISFYLYDPYCSFAIQAKLVTQEYCQPSDKVIVLV